MLCPGGVSPHRVAFEFFAKPAESNMCKRVKRNRLISNNLVSGQTLGEAKLRGDYPTVYQHLYGAVWHERQQNPRPKYAREW